MIKNQKNQMRTLEGKKDIRDHRNKCQKQHCELLLAPNKHQLHTESVIPENLFNQAELQACSCQCFSIDQKLFDTKQEEVPRYKT